MGKKLKSKIPSFNKGLLDVADACARDLWNGINHQTGDKIYSDEALLSLFGAHYSQLILEKTLNQAPQFGPTEIDLLIDVCGLQQMNRMKANQDIKGGLNHLYGPMLKTVKDDVYSAKVIHPEYESFFIRSLGESFYKKSSPSQKGAYITLASRLLFFATPSLIIFNYSGSIADKIGLRGDSPREALPFYNIALYDGLRENWSKLSTYKMPLPTIHVDNDTWLLAMRGGWWQRRIFDLALLINFELTTPRSFLTEVLKYDALLDP